MVRCYYIIINIIILLTVFLLRASISMAFGEKFLVPFMALGSGVQHVECIEADLLQGD